MLAALCSKLADVLCPLPLKGYLANRVSAPRLAHVSDADIARLNKMLPWKSFVIDAAGRRVGSRASIRKRSSPADIPDARIVNLNSRFSLADKVVLEVGCFEGTHTVALAQLARRVVACDSRVEHLVKCLVRCWMCDVKADIYLWDVETPVPQGLSIDCDILHHVGVLYHLADPIEHLRAVLPHVSLAVMLDTHVAAGNKELRSYPTVPQYRFQYYNEAGRRAPFAGMRGHAKWLREEDLLAELTGQGFRCIDVAERRKERNGDRVLIYAVRTKG